MQDFDISNYYRHIIASVIIIVAYYVLLFITKKLINNFSTISDKTDKRSKLIMKYFNGVYSFFAIVSFLLVWGIETTSALAFLGTITAFIGVALFAQWSVLSNFTAGVIMFFSFPYKIGDRIVIQDKDFPIEAIIDDIKTFHTILISDEGEYICYPNNLFLQKSVIVK